MRRVITASLWILWSVLAVHGAHARSVIENIYQAQTITTGLMEENRPAAFARCLMDVLVKASGDPRLLNDRRAIDLSQDAVRLVRTFRYRDRLEGVPIHDEQGTRDRPHDLTVEFDPDRVLETLRTLGREPWTADRPLIALIVSVHFGSAPYILAQDGERGIDQREALHAASQRVGVPVTLPEKAIVEAARIDPSAAPVIDAAAADALAHQVGADLALVGRMTFSDQAGGWVADWSLSQPKGITHWVVRGVNFDEAFRNALRGAGQILSGNGEPESQ
jgi:hypothetical protein